MNRHPFRWQSAAAGALFLAIAGNWAVWEAEVLTGEEISRVVAGLLIVLGLVGVVATFWRPRPTTHIEPTIDPIEKEMHDEQAADPHH